MYNRYIRMNTLANKVSLSRTIRAKQSGGARCVVLVELYRLLEPEWYRLCIVYIYTHMVRDMRMYLAQA